MPSATVKVSRVGQKEPIYPDLKGREIIHINDQNLQLALLERGVESGKSSVSIRVDLPGGKVLIFETSAAIWKTATDAMRAFAPEEF